jgi:hypothetical protein
MGAILTVALLSIAYAYVDVYSPIVGYISLAFVVFFAFGVGWTVSKLGYIAHCRSLTFMGLAGLGTGLLALYVSWAAFEYVLLARNDESFTASLMDVIRSPGAVWETAKVINREGWYSIKGWTPKGGALWAFWGIEAAIIVGFSALFAGHAILEQVYCERCGRWCTAKRDVKRLGLPQSDDQLAQLQPNNLEPLASLGRASPRQNPFVRLDTWLCEKCKRTAAVQAKVVTIVTDKEGKPEEKTEDLTEVWSVTPAALEQIRSF